jgi:hypothetical protein
MLSYEYRTNISAQFGDGVNDTNKLEPLIKLIPVITGAEQTGVFVGVCV